MENYNIDMVAVMPNPHFENGEASEGKLTRHLTLHSEIPLLVLD
ncbi:hypothetical protein RM545_13835 [Zunongwangia sp. F260]|uniref:Uncharacterized protein n=1 Tax=Autumnicola lenta TaxID=3075593 RepID=A0ABU3CNA7_9FLAO|nr:hypothetical protein [Zunongwangia sp. F260]MDT0647776.1 hypothetical protein [Zunongwangia sp. F260]